MSRYLRVAAILMMAIVAALSLDIQTARASSIVALGNCNVAIAQATVDAGTGGWYLKLSASNQSQISYEFFRNPNVATTHGFSMNFSPPVADGTIVTAQILDSLQNLTTVASNYRCSTSARLPCTNQDIIDGRLNSVCADRAQTAALYCNIDSTSLHIDALRNSMGVFAFDVTQAELNKFPALPKVNTLIKQGMGISLWRLTTGELQFNTPGNDTYIFGHPGDAPVTFYQMCTGAVTWYKPG